jgi:Zn-dependent protease with chaperone function/tetratricopeptide (TPR) repeat protein
MSQLMSAVLVLLLLAQPEPDDCARLEQRLAAQFAEAVRLGENDPAGAIRLLNEILNDPQGREMEGRSYSVRTCREWALYNRSALRLRQGENQAVADAMTALLDRKNTILLVRSVGLVAALATTPNASLGTAISLQVSSPLERTDRIHALSLRASAYTALGQHDKAKGDQAEIVEISRELAGAPSMPSETFPPGPLSDWWQWIGSGLRHLLVSANGPVVVAIVFVGTLALFFLSGLRQRREARGSWRRLFWVALALAALQTLPIVAALLLWHWRPWLSYRSALPYVTPLVLAAHFLWHLAHLGAVRWVRSRQAPSLLEDPVVLERITHLADRLGIAPPLTRLVRSPSSLQTTQAFVTGLAAPTMVLFDGILYRLTPEERDAIIAHELAHLANHTFWARLLAGATCAVATVAVAAFCPVLVAITFGVVLMTGVFLALSRRLELDCDRRAARAIGHRRAASALFKLHADQYSQLHGVTEFLLGAVASHPSRDQRLAAIHDDAHAADRPPIEWDGRLLFRRRLAAWLAAGLWLAVILASLEWGQRWNGSNWPALPMLLMETALVGLFILAERKTQRRRRELHRTVTSWRNWLALLAPVLLIGLFVADSSGLTTPYMDRWTVVCLLVVAALATLSAGLLQGGARANRLNHKVGIAILSGDFPAALALCEGSPGVVARSTALRYNHAVIRAVLGRREEALIDLEKLRGDDPRFKMSWLLLASVYSEEGDYARALSLAEELSRDLPGNPIGLAAAAWMLRRLGRLEEAEARAREVLKLDERFGMAHLTLAGVAIDRGDLATAREELAQAERLVPGSMTAALLTAEMALAAGSDDAEAAVREAVRAAQRSPLAFCNKPAARLVERLESMRRAPQA